MSLRSRVTAAERKLAYTAEEDFGELPDLTGSTLEEFLSNLDDMHVRVALIFPDRDPSLFERVARDDGSSELHYRTKRDGLAPMVIGMIKGLANRFGIAVSIEQIAVRGNGSDHDVFHIQKA